MFENLIKIIRPIDASDSKNSILFEEFSSNFISAKEIKSKKLLPQFLKDLEDFNEKLEVLMIELYQSGEGGKLQREYDKVLLNLRNKQSKLNYLSSFFATTKTKIEAAQQKIIECEKKLIEDEDRKAKIDDRMEGLRKYKCNKPHKKNFTLNPWPLHSSIWGANIHQETSNEVNVAIESPVDSQASTAEISTDSVIEENNEDDDNDEENWSDFTNDLDDLD